MQPGGGHGVRGVRRQARVDRAHWQLVPNLPCFRSYQVAKLRNLTQMGRSTSPHDYRSRLPIIVPLHTVNPHRSLVE